MDDDKKPVWFMDGPLAGKFPAEVFGELRKKHKIAIPVTEQLELTDHDLWAFIIYEKWDIPGDALVYQFRGFKKTDDSPFIVTFADGPFAGERPFYQPIQGLPHLVFVPLRSEPYAGEGRQRIIAMYEKRVDDGVDKLFHVETTRHIVTDTRILFEFVGGPLDGLTLDSDSGWQDREGAWKAKANYFMSDSGTIGKRFWTASPHSLAALEEFGEIALKYGGPFSAHKYEVVDKLEEPYEVYVRAKYVTSDPDEEQ